MVDDIVVDLAKLDHPGGNHIILAIIGRDITKFMIGASSFDNLPAHVHSSTSHKYLSSLQINVL